MNSETIICTCGHPRSEHFPEREGARCARKAFGCKCYTFVAASPDGPARVLDPSPNESEDELVILGRTVDRIMRVFADEGLLGNDALEVRQLERVIRGVATLCDVAVTLDTPLVRSFLVAHQAQLQSALDLVDRARNFAREPEDRTESSSLERARRVWDAINEYAGACGGDTSEATISVRRQQAVVRVERAIARPPRSFGCDVTGECTHERSRWLEHRYGDRLCHAGETSAWLWCGDCGALGGATHPNNISEPGLAKLAAVGLSPFWKPLPRAIRHIESEHERQRSAANHIAENARDGRAEWLVQWELTK